MVTKRALFPLAQAAAVAAEEKKGIDLLALDVRKVSSITDCFLFVGASSHVHVRSLEDAIRSKLQVRGAHLKQVDGKRGNHWRVLDFGNLIIHIMNQNIRDFYSLERLWREGKKIPLKSSPSLSKIRRTSQSQRKPRKK